MYSYQNGWPGVPGVQLPFGPCGSTPCNPYPPCGPNGCPILLDSTCVIYHKNMNTTSGLINLNLPNGSTLELILNTIDAQLGQLNVPLWSLPFLRAVPYTIGTLQQFGQAVDTEFSVLSAAIIALQTAVAVPLVANDSTTIDFTQSGTLNHTFTGMVKVSANAFNLLAIEPDGLYATPQTLSIDAVNKLLTITEGNTVDFSSLICGASGFLGNVTVDPTSTDGQYWWNTTSNQLKIKVNGIIKIITTT
jgi:hypothetical protein